MVFESLITPLKVHDKPWKLYFVGVAIALIAGLISIQVFAQDASLMMVFFTVLSSVPFIYVAIILEEKKDLSGKRERWLLKEHGKTLTYFMFLFLGFVTAYTGLYLALPESGLFTTQLRDLAVIENLGNGITGNFASTVEIFNIIFLNNFKVMLFSLAFSFFYGFGAIFILTWNASVLSVAIGKFIAANIHEGIVLALHASILRYFIHGIPEMLAYFTAGLAGGIISVAVIKHHYKTPEFKRIVVDSLDLMVCAVCLLIVSALIEVFVVPQIF